jgi:hypothetical protein
LRARLRRPAELRELREHRGDARASALLALLLGLLLLERDRGLHHLLLQRAPTHLVGGPIRLGVQRGGEPAFVGHGQP